MEVQVPFLGPDLIDPRRIPEIKAKAEELAQPAAPAIAEEKA